jgi:maltose-binding protein MalE
MNKYNVKTDLSWEDIKIWYKDLNDEYMKKSLLPLCIQIFGGGNIYPTKFGKFYCNQNNEVYTSKDNKIYLRELKLKRILNEI